ncbi:MAG: hypothetical protein H6752_18390 [Candidatus Omnitrophica bacterium]|nr:hypothetical protein [Candidatus Omnitrophota bacterium]
MSFAVRIQSMALAVCLFSLHGAQAQKLNFTSAPQGYEATSIDLPNLFTGALGVDPTNENRAYASVGSFGENRLALVDLETETSWIVATGPFGAISGIAVFSATQIALVENGSNPEGPPDETILLATDSNADGDFDDDGEIEELIAPILIGPDSQFGFNGAQARIAPLGDPSGIPSGSLIVQTADGNGNSELLVIEDPLGSPAYRPDGAAYFSGFDFNGGFDFDSAGNILLGSLSSTTFQGQIEMLVNTNGDEDIDPGESNLIVEGERLSGGLSDLAIDADNHAFCTSSGIVATFAVPVDPLNKEATPSVFIETDSFFLSGILMNTKSKSFIPYSGPDGAKMIVGDGIGTTNLMILTPSASSATPIPTATATPVITPAPFCEDLGLYVLDSFGGRHRVGPNVVQITGGLYFGRDVAVDMENVDSGDGSPNADLAVLDRFGAVQFVENTTATPSQMFYFPEGSNPECGYAVDFEVTHDSTGFWVLTEAGGIFRGGSTTPGDDARLGNDAAELCTVLNIPFGGDVPRHPDLPQSDGATIRAVGFVVVQSGNHSNPDGFVVLDSQGGHYVFDGEGNSFDDGVEGSILDSETKYPFFMGLDIARDIELHPVGTAVAGLAIYDGWGGVHPVPVEDTAGGRVGFLRNDPPITTVGLPYIQGGFDDPSTGEDEGNPAEVGIDVGSIFRDLEFCQAPTGDGIYVMDSFGGLFAFGNTRLTPDSVATRFSNSPYFFPNPLAVDVEAQTVAETEFRAD